MKTMLRMLIALVWLSALGCLGIGSAPGDQISTLDVKLVMAKAPALNEPVVITTTITAGRDMRVSAHLDLFLAKAEILSGDTGWSIDLKKDVPATFTTTLRFIEERGHLITVDAYGIRGMHAAASVGVYVTRTGGTFDIPRPTPGPRMPLTPLPPSSWLVRVSVYHQRSFGSNLPITDMGDWVVVPTTIDDAPANVLTTKVRLKYRIMHPKPEDLEVRLVHAQSGRYRVLWNRQASAGGETGCRSTACGSCGRETWQAVMRA